MNTARGEVLDHAALVRGLQAGSVRGAALDVLDNEKLAQLNVRATGQFRLSESQALNVVLTPHVGGWTHESYVRINEVLTEKIRAFRAGPKAGIAEHPAPGTKHQFSVVSLLYRKGRTAGQCASRSLCFFTRPTRYAKPDLTTMATINYYTAEGLQKLKDELQDLKVRGRAKAAEDLREARDKGDLSENAEYDAAKDAQGLLELKISKLEEVLGNARVLDETNMDFSKVLIQSKVKLKNLKNNMELNYVLVAEEEADLAAGKISVKSPIGKGLLGKEVGDVAEITVPAGKLQFEILEVGR